MRGQRLWSVIVLLTSVLFVFSEAANSSNPKLRCFYCRHSRRTKDVADGVDQDPDCLSSEKMGHDMTRVCSAREDYCSSAVTNLNGFLVEINRDCSEACSPGCWEHGFGLFQTLCVRCCNSTLCNDFDKQLYYRPLSAPNAFCSTTATVLLLLEALFVYL
uniref:Toxin_TOLIP domain-containing protein n=1 Tax=Steinernema glaseri TaxID=37863 RepID=A0A1I7XX33_9BILA